ncbi:hypothetical protein [Spirillospora sp. NBC_01491]|uniref:hypothetical protein n=1 Tax=Spirillospora sp. NBC_01491 TaxID=2976007 RepID=UPI002E33C1CD|nr:hypothetical protein [Spirillospora sp. NBC_01491]
MFEHTQVTGIADDWIALPDGYQPGQGSYERVAIGVKEATKMFGEVKRLIGSLPTHPKDAPAKLIVRYSPVLTSSIGREIDATKKNGPKVGVFCVETFDATQRR